MFKLAYKLGFKTSKVKDFIFNCGDHLILADIDAFAEKLIHIFLQCCGEYKNLQPTIENSVSWCNQKVVNPNFDFYSDLLFKIFLSLKCYRAGMRRIYDFITSNKSFSRSSDEYREGGDYITENENKHIKGHLGPRVSTFQHWVTASRNHDKLQASHEAVFETASLKDPRLQLSLIFKFDIKVHRTVICDSFISDDPYSQLPLKAICGTLLHHDLVNFMFKTMGNYNLLIEI